MEIMVVKPIVEVEVGADVAAAVVEKKGEASVEREKCGGEDGCPAGDDSGGGG